MKITEAIDMYNGNMHHYPPKKEDINLLIQRYDFIFTKNNKWFYNASTDDVDILKKITIHKVVEEKGEKWALINNLTGEVLKHNL